MRILLVNDCAVPAGGAENITRTIRDELRVRGHDARIFASDARPSAGALFADYTCRGDLSRMRAVTSTVNLSAARSLRAVIREFRPDLVHVRMFLTQLSPSILPVLRGLPCLLHVVWYRAICPKGTKMLPDGSRCRFPAGVACLREGCVPPWDWPLNMVQLGLVRRWRAVFGHIVANSHAVAASLREAGFGEAEVIWNGTPARPMRPPLSEPPMVAYSGRLVREKGVDVLLRAFALASREVPAARLLVAGDGPERAALQELARTLERERQVHFLGHVLPEQLEEKLAGAWVQAVPSRWAEPFGVVTAEAMMRGTAVIVSNTGGSAEVVSDGETGLLVPPDDAPALAAALCRVLGDRERAEALGRAGRARAVEQLSMSLFVDRIEGAYARLPGVGPGS